MESQSTAIAVLTAPDECASSAAGTTSSWAQSAALEFQATLQLLAERARFLIAADSVAIALREGGEFVYAATTPDSAGEVGSAADVTEERMRQCIESRKPVSSFADGSSSLVIPVLRDETVIGLFQLCGRSPFEDRDEQAVSRLAELIKTAIDHKDAALRAESCGFEEIPEVTEVSEIQETAEVVKAKDIAETPELPDVPQAPTAGAAPTLWHAPAESDASPAEPSEAEARPPAVTAPVVEIQNCSSCGFPVSPGRKFCVDCEKHSEIPSAPVEMFSTQTQESWVSAYGYTVASIIVSALAIAIIVWLRR